MCWDVIFCVSSGDVSYDLAQSAATHNGTAISLHTGCEFYQHISPAAVSYRGEIKQRVFTETAVIIWKDVPSFLTVACDFIHFMFVFEGQWTKINLGPIQKCCSCCPFYVLWPSITHKVAFFPVDNEAMPNSNNTVNNFFQPCSSIFCWSIMDHNPLFLYYVSLVLPACSVLAHLFQLHSKLFCSGARPQRMF